jgi:hypothetical protein
VVPSPAQHAVARDELKGADLPGQTSAYLGETPGQYVIFDSSYREIKRFRAGNGYNGDHHEFFISPQDTALIRSSQALTKRLVR